MNTFLLLAALVVDPQSLPLDVIAAPAIVCPVDPAGMYLDQMEVSQ